MFILNDNSWYIVYMLIHIVRLTGCRYITAIRLTQAVLLIQ